MRCLHSGQHPGEGRDSQVPGAHGPHTGFTCLSILHPRALWAFTETAPTFLLQWEHLVGEREAEPLAEERSPNDPPTEKQEIRPISGTSERGSEPGSLSQRYHCALGTQTLCTERPQLSVTPTTWLTLSR